MLRAALALALLAACGGDGTTPVPDPPAKATVDEYAAADSAFGCLSYGCLFGIAPTELPAFCGVDARIADRRAGVEAGRLAFDGVKAKACVTALKAYGPLACWGPTADFTADVDTLLAKCEGVLVPKVAIGGACVLSEECVGGFCKADDACPGTCQARRGGGEACGKGEECADGLACVGSRCLVRADEGGACTSDSACAGLLWCSDGKCAKPLKENDPCDPDTGHCDASTYCARIANTTPGGRCLARVAAGGTCDVGSADTLGVASPQCAGNQVCVGLVTNAAGGVDALGHCGLPSDAGGACVPTTGAPGPEQPDTACFLGILCEPESKTCRALPGPGTACVGGECNLGSYCAAGICAAKKAAGATCATSAECVDFCVSGVCARATKQCHAP